MSKFTTLSASLACVALLGFGLAYCQSPEDNLESALRAVTAQEAQLNAKIAAIKQRQLELQRKNGFYARLEMKGRLEKKIVMARNDPRDIQMLDTIIWAVTAGEHRYELSFGNSPKTEGFVNLAEKSIGKTVLVAGELAPPRHPQSQILEVAAFSAPEADPEDKAANADLVKGLIVTGTLKQAIGTFSSFGIPSVGNTFEIDLTNLPKDKIVFTRPKSDPLAQSGASPSYMPFHAPMSVTRVQQVKKETGPRRTVIELSAIDRHDKFVIRIMAEDLAKGSKVIVIFYHPADVIGSMAEAEGVLK